MSYEAMMIIIGVVGAVALALFTGWWLGIIFPPKDDDSYYEDDWWDPPL